MDWFHFIQTKIGKEATVILIATKIDILKEEILNHNKRNIEKNHISLEKRILDINNSILFFF